MHRQCSGLGGGVMLGGHEQGETRAGSLSTHSASRFLGVSFWSDGGGEGVGALEKLALSRASWARLGGGETS